MHFYAALRRTNNLMRESKVMTMSAREEDAKRHPAEETTSRLTPQEEFERLLQRSYHRAFSAAYRMMGNASDAEDLTQEAFLRVWAAFDRYDRSRPFEGWLFRILSNLAIDRWRRIGNISTCSLDAEMAGMGTTGRNRIAAGSSREGRGTPLIACLADERPSVMPELSFLRAEN